MSHGEDGEVQAETVRVEGQSSGDSADFEVGISSIRELLADQNAALHVCVCVCVL